MRQALLDQFAQRLQHADAGAGLLSPISDATEWFDDAAAYRVAKRVLDARVAAGWQPIGRKIGFTNRTIWATYNVHGPMWAHVYDRTVSFALGGCGEVALGPHVQPRIEPEIAVRFRSAPAGDDPGDLLESIDWVAPSFEVVQCHFPDWRFRAPDTIADFGLHGHLLVGTPVPREDLPPAAWLRALEGGEVLLRRGDRVVDRGRASNVLGGPLHALGFLVRLLRDQPQFAPLAAGEIVTTGTLTDAHPVAPGECWRSTYDGVGLGGMCVRFTAAGKPAA